jgi:hypothetical protein
MHACMRVYMYACMYVCMYLCTYVHMYVCLDVNMYVMVLPGDPVKEQRTGGLTYQISPMVVSVGR